ncbi:hypothetical protein [Modestobacter sp. Leaf380]|uniref:hypothetical protein n=1 Tax=Modestobacter sp. Leaf380 TaxID=1736356 RepID=UPI0006FD52BA|nr:hypothetical protein [Modestobacter sp. Leaf380]KQS66975.1 hypothetical protein ASG41_09020 [Modestobacter sp. Leaf380]
MTLRLTAAQTEALRRRAQEEHASMQEVAKRALTEYLAAHDRRTPLDLVLDDEISRHGVALQELGRWRD